MAGGGIFIVLFPASDVSGMFVFTTVYITISQTGRYCSSVGWIWFIAGLMAVSYTHLVMQDM